MTAYFWSTTGSTGNPGTQLAPKRNLSEVLPLLGPSDTAYGRGGIYTEGDFDPPSGSSNSTRITIAAYPGETVTMQPSSGDRVFTFRASSYITINRLILDAINCTYDCVKTEESGGVYAHHIRLQDSELKNARGNGVLLAGNPVGGQPGGFNELLRNNIHDNARFNFSPFGHGCYITSPSNILDGNSIHDHNSDTAHNSLAIHVYNSGQGGLDNQIIRRNRIYRQTRGGGILVADGSSAKIYRNLVYDNWNGIVLFGGSSGVLALNNVVYRSSNGGMYIKGTSGVQLINNIVWLNGTDLLYESGAYTSDHDLIGVNPLFVDPDNGDFRLQSGSAAINAWQDTSALVPDNSFDFYGNPVS